MNTSDGREETYLINLLLAAKGEKEFRPDSFVEDAVYLP